VTKQVHQNRVRLHITKEAWSYYIFIHRKVCPIE